VLHQQASIIGAVAGATTALLLAAANLDRPEVRLNSNEEQSIESIYWAQLHGDSQTILSRLSPMYSNGVEGKRAAIDKALADLGAPGAVDLLSHARLALIRQGLDLNKLPRAGEREAIAMLKAINAELATAIELSQQAPDDSIADGLNSLEMAVWSTHVLENRLETARLLAHHATQLRSNFPRSQLSKLSEDERALIMAGQPSIEAKLQRALELVEEYEIAVRRNRLIVARAVLEQPQWTNDKLLAAYVADFDTRVITQFLDTTKKQRRSFARAELGKQAFADQVNDEAARARTGAGPLTLKARLFFEGLHWWLRGRYGTGAEVGGLAKSAAALRSPIAQMGLYMPSVNPQPTDPVLISEAESVPRFERRHHYWWAWEDRTPLHIAPKTVTETRPSNTFTATLTQFW
jgi:hypothetical protein